MKRKLLPSVISLNTIRILFIIAISLLALYIIFTIWTFKEILSYDEVLAELYAYDYDNDTQVIEYVYKGFSYKDTVLGYDNPDYLISGYVNPDNPSNFICLKDMTVIFLIIFGVVGIIDFVLAFIAIRALKIYYIPKKYKKLGLRKLGKIYTIDNAGPNRLIINVIRDGSLYKSITLIGDYYYWRDIIKQYTYNVPIYFYKKKYYVDFEEIKSSIDNF